MLKRRPDAPIEGWGFSRPGVPGPTPPSANRSNQPRAITKPGEIRVLDPSKAFGFGANGACRERDYVGMSRGNVKGRPAYRRPARRGRDELRRKGSGNHRSLH